MNDSKFSLVIPTMWRYAPFITFLSDIVKFDLIDEIIIINNDKSKTPTAEVLTDPKIRIISFDQNIYVNPAWNIGVRESKNKFIGILNDDIIFDIKVFYHVREILSPQSGVIGICIGDKTHNQPPFQTGSIKIKPWEGESTMGFGCLMFVHKDTWIDIPIELKVYYGDNWIFDTALWEKRTNYLITDLLHFTPHAQTTGTIENDFLDKETPIYKQILEIWKHNLFETHRLQIEYDRACSTPSDINEHLPILKALAENVSHVTEFGVRSGNSTRAFLNSNTILRSYDLNLDPNVQELFKIAKTQGKNVEYIQGNVLNLSIEQTDLLFIDTLHAYHQLKQELALHANQVRKYICFHDTQTFGTLDEATGLKNGLLPAIIEFLIDHPEWKFHLHRMNNNGFTVLERI